MLSILADLNDDMLIIISDANGANLLASANIYGNIPSDSDIMSDLASNGQLTLNGNLGGVLSSDYLICAYPINDADGELSGAVFACSPVQGLDPLIETMVKTIIMSCLWVMLAALLAVYFISDKIIDPLKKMSKAAKSFAAGKIRRACAGARSRRGGRACDRVQQYGVVARRLRGYAPHLPCERIA